MGIKRWMRCSPAPPWPWGDWLLGEENDQEKNHPDLGFTLFSLYFQVGELTWICEFDVGLQAQHVAYVDICSYFGFCFKVSVSCWLLGGGSCWFSFHVTFRAHGEVKGSHWCSPSWTSGKIVLLPDEWEDLSLSDFHELCSLSGLGQEDWPTVLPSLPALHLALIKYTADDVSLAPGSFSFPLRTKHPGRQLWQLSLKTQA